MADLIKIPHYLLKTETTFIGKRNGSIQTRIKDDLYKSVSNDEFGVCIHVWSVLEKACVAKDLDMENKGSSQKKLLFRNNS